MNTKESRETYVKLVVPEGAKDRSTSTHLAVEVGYRKGTGFVLRVYAVGIEDQGTYKSVLYDLFMGYRANYALEPAGRFNAKKLEKLAAATFADLAAKRGQVWAMIEEAVRNKGWELAAEAA